MTQALQRYNAEQSRVIPIILHPCDWKSAPFCNLLAVPRDGNPISKYPNQHDAFLEVVNAIKQAVKEISPESSSPFQPNYVSLNPQEYTKKPRSSNLRVRKVYSEYDRDEFQIKTFEYIANFFEESLKELEK